MSHVALLLDSTGSVPRTDAAATQCNARLQAQALISVERSLPVRTLMS